MSRLPPPPPLDKPDVHVWCTSLDEPPIPQAELLAVLNTQERERAARFHFTRDRVRNIASRGLLRWLLAGYLNVEPAAIEFRFGPQGKPALAGHDAALEFNVAHADEMALYAVTRGRQVGVDVERLRPMPDALGIAERFFAAGERATLRRVPPHGIAEAFFACWTRKEAYVKALGEGIIMPLDEFEVDMQPGTGKRQLRTLVRPEEAARWSLFSLVLNEDFVGAVAVESAHARVVGPMHLS